MERKLQVNNEASDNEDINKQFHPAFCDAMTQIFENDTVKYIYEREYNLNSMPNRIDFLVIRLDEDKNACNGIDSLCIDNRKQSVNGIAKLCRTYNIFEYKSPGQQLSVDEYYVAMAYVYLYAGKENDSEAKQRARSILDLVSRLNCDKEWMKEMKSMGAFRDLFKEEFEEKDKQIQDLSEQLHNKEEQLQSKDEQLQSKDKEVKSLKEEIEHLKEQMRNNKIAML